MNRKLKFRKYTLNYPLQNILPTHAVVHVELEFALRDRLLDPLAVARVARPPPAPPPVVHQAARLLAVPVVRTAAR